MYLWLKSACTFMQSDQFWLGALWIGKDSTFIQADSEDWSDCVDALSDLSYCWEFMSEGTLSFVAAHNYVIKISL